MQSQTSIEVLNISNRNAAGNFVLNDAKLIELVQLYPFLYNPRVRPFQDPDYEEWAWHRITTAFNRSYDDIQLYFSPSNLQCRWQTLLPIIHRLRDQSNIPEPLRQILVKINVHLQDQTTDVRANNFSVPQKLILANIEMVRRLPHVERRRLEAEMMEIIITTELQARGTVKLSAFDLQRVKQEYTDFLKAIQLKELFVLSEKKKPMPSDSSVSTSAEPLPEAVIDLDGEDVKDVIKMEEIHEAEVQEQIMLFQPDPVELQPMQQVFQPDSGELQLMQQTRWIPLADAKLYVRPCVVRIRRTVVEDDLPLAVIKKKTVKD